MSIAEKLAALFPQSQITTHPDQLAVVSQDESTLPGVLPQVLVWPESAVQIREVVLLCIETGTPITTRGAGSALEGSTIPHANGIVLDVSRMTKVVDYWPDDLQIRVQPGIVYDDLNEKLKRDGLFFPPSPGGSGDIATVGGMVSTNASGIYSVKYGGTKDYVLQMEIVTGKGEILTPGCRATKRSSGYDLTDLITGSEGTLAIISSITLKLAGLPEGRLQTAFTFPDEIAAAKAVSEICRYGIDIAAIEFLDRELIHSLNLLKEYGLTELPSLFLEFHGLDATTQSNSELTASICNELGGKPLTLADNQRPWEVRHWATEAIKQRMPGHTIIRNDVAFPISSLPVMVEFCRDKSRQNGLLIHAFGHVGLGLLHALILADRNDDAQWKLAKQVNDDIIRKALELGGTISGEHGIGLGHKNLFELE
ncbi:MAG: FAD-binding oxidoreductase, partial [Candidatus Zixiibacteriota bacterium]